MELYRLLDEMDEAKIILAKSRARAGIFQGANNYGLDKIHDRTSVFSFLRTE